MDITKPFSYIPDLVIYYRRHKSNNNSGFRQTLRNLEKQLTLKKIRETQGNPGKFIFSQATQGNSGNFFFQDSD